MTSNNSSHIKFIKKGNEDTPSDWVENMVSFFSRRMYDKLIPYLDLFYGELNLVSGYGLDRPVAQKIISDNGYKCRIINSVVMEHTKPVTSREKRWRNGLTSREVDEFIVDYIKLNEPKSHLDLIKKIVKDKPPTYTIRS